MDPEKLKKFIERDLPGFEIADAPSPASVDSDSGSGMESISPAVSLDDWRGKPVYSPGATKQQESAYLKKFNWKKSSPASEL